MLDGRSKRRKLTDKQATQLKKEWLDGVGYRKLSVKYGISSITARQIVLGLSYQEVLPHITEQEFKAREERYGRKPEQT